MREHPEVASKLNEMLEQGVQTPHVTDPKIAELEVQVKSIQIEKELDLLKSENPSMDELAILQIATQKGCSVKDAYGAWLADNYPTLMKKQLQEHSMKVTEEMKKNAMETKTLINPGDKPDAGTHGLTPIELEYAAKLGMTPEEYAKWK
jgi:hypothetical protein